MAGYGTTTAANSRAEYFSMTFTLGQRPVNTQAMEAVC